MAAPFRLYNTLSRRVEEFVPRDPGKVSLYMCGMTVYDHAHVGHARAMVVFDTVIRYLKYRGWQTRYVRNFTDIDDKIIRRANETNVTWDALAQQQIDDFRVDMLALGLTPPDAEPRVTHTIEGIIAMIQQLVDRGHAYVVDGSVWFAVDTFSTYGKLSGQKVENLRNEDVGNKRAAVDFALWKAEKPGEPAWDSPWGRGRPGWHIECSAMSCQELGAGFDIHGGGLDLVFPHHENEIAQAEGATGESFVRYWMHNGLLTVGGGQKMGHSLGNFVTIRDLLTRFPAEALRLYYLQNHYRSPLPWDTEVLPEALAMLARLYDAREVAQQMRGSEPADEVAEQLGKHALDVLELGRTFERRLHAAMDDDLNTSLALGHALELARAVNRFANHKKARKRGGPVVAPALDAFARFHEALGLLAVDTDAFHAEVADKHLALKGLERATIDGLVTQRAEARAAKDWARADALRDELAGHGIEVRDTADGATWRVVVQGGN